MSNIGLKICGMNENTAEVAALRPDYLGFIFYEKSPRNYTAERIFYPPGASQNVGVFVDASEAFILEKIKRFNLQVVQLHGDESPYNCASLKNAISLEAQRSSDAHPNQGVHNIKDTDIWKVFSVKDSFDFSVVKAYEPFVDAFLFDTKGAAKGGNGITFNWEILKEYPSKKPFVLSGGIGLEEVSEIKKLIQSNIPLMAVDVNSKFEDAPGLKNIQKLKKFKEELATIIEPNK
ncbi:phosphoribosylanthranilate isomerase [Jejudonia soesokkakensis]|uniref:N-(5'-phosphoribosyl)anthranilate isomerase n=1 Tax=Jejudonia soesokkakensis TaxID=1323432 RepID=A0ABW2MPJ9_9FLAO